MKTRVSTQNNKSSCGKKQELLDASGQVYFRVGAEKIILLL